MNKTFWTVRVMSAIDCEEEITEYYFHDRDKAQARFNQLVKDAKEEISGFEVRDFVNDSQLSDGCGTFYYYEEHGDNYYSYWKDGYYSDDHKDIQLCICVFED